VPRSGFLFSGTAADNIRFGRPDASRADIEAAARAVGAEAVIAGLPHGFDTKVGERGVLLSAGERQLIAFARAWIADLYDRGSPAWPERARRAGLIEQAPGGTLEPSAKVARLSQSPQDAPATATHRGGSRCGRS
jgi:hypothetical protein